MYGTGRSVHRPFNYRSISVRRPFFFKRAPVVRIERGNFVLTPTVRTCSGYRISEHAHTHAHTDTHTRTLAHTNNITSHCILALIYKMCQKNLLVSPPLHGRPFRKTKIEQLLNGYRMYIARMLKGSHTFIPFYLRTCMYILVPIRLHV